MRQGLLGPFANLLQGDGLPLLGQDGRDHRLVAALGGQPHDGDLLDLRHGAHGGLDLRRIDVESAGDDELLATVGDDVEAVLLLTHQVPGAQPAPGQHDRLGLLGVLPVSGEDLRAAGDQFADLTGLDLPLRVIRVDDAHIGRGVGHAQCAGAPLGGDGVAQDDGGGLGHAVALDDDSIRGLLPGLGDRLGVGGGAAHGDLAARQIGSCRPGARDDAVEHDGHAGEEGRGMPLPGGQDHVGAELGQHHLGGGQTHGAQERQAQSEGVEEGQDGVEGLLAGLAGLGRPCQ